MSKPGLTPWDFKLFLPRILSPLVLIMPDLPHLLYRIQEDMIAHIMAPSAAPDWSNEFLTYLIF